MIGCANQPDIHEFVEAVRRIGLAGSPDWLATDRACDLPLTENDAAKAETAARRAIGDAAIDVLVQPAEGRRKRIFVAELTRRAMNGELDFATALKERVALLKGLPATVLDEAAGHIRLMPGARPLLATLRAAGVRTALVSGGFTVFVERIAAELGFDRVSANRLDITEEIGRAHV